jgi:hypothetical protein
MKDNDQLGRAPKDGEGRDAIHVAIIPQVAIEDVYPGQDIEKDGVRLGIVDPFLGHKVQAGESFWLLLVPRTITSLKHVWEHPQFDKEIVVDDVEVAARAQALKVGMTLERIIEEIDGYEDGDYMHLGHDLTWQLELSWEPIWTYFEKVKGRKVQNKSHVPYSCAC